LSRAPKAPEPRAAQSNPEDLPPASLLSRLTSRQLLKRATGGRAESFSPGPEDSDDGSDFPLEPGTDAPLASALADAPSSDTEFMSGARKGRLTPSFGADAQRSDASTGASDHPVVDDDFLAAARRAARAASAEVSESEHRPAFVRSTAGLGRIFTVGRRRALLGAVLAAVLVIAAVQIVRLQLLPVEPEIAALPDASAPAATPEPLSAPASSPTASVPDTAPADLRPEETESAATEEPAADVSAPPATALAPAIAPESTPDAAATTEAPAAEPQTEVATAPSEPEEAQTPLESMQPELAALPLAIGPDRLREAAMAGDAIAAFEVAARYAEGRGVAPDMRAAVAWYERSGGAGLAPAQYRLGSIFEKGTGVPRDLAAAQDWYRRAADAGNVKAMHNLAVLYAEGAGGTPDLERASALFRQAAEHGVRDSQFNLAILHARGLGVPQDLIEAYKWFAIAATSGDEESIKRRDIIAAALSESDLATAKAAAASFQPAPLIAEANEVQMPDDGWGEDNSNVEVKSDNELVALIQKLLAENGYDPGPPDGLLGEKTIEALSAFQGKAGLPQTGQIDEKTMAALQAPST
jgi:localization factor PodJL